MEKFLNFSDLARKMGNSLEKIKRRNKLIDETRKQYNPTFLEIMEELKNDDKTLFNMMMVWYMSKNSIDNYDDIYDSIKKIVNENQNHINYSGSCCDDCGCGCDEDEFNGWGGAC